MQGAPSSSSYSSRVFGPHVRGPGDVQKTEQRLLGEGSGEVPGNLGALLGRGGWASESPASCSSSLCSCPVPRVALGLPL